MSDDGGFFVDADQLGLMLDDTRKMDLLVVSSTEDAKSIVEDFRTRDIASPWVSLDRQEVADRLLQLIDEPRAIYQGALNLCGPASLICMWNARDPVGFATYATELYDAGTSFIGNLEIAPRAEILSFDFNSVRAQAFTWAADWMVLGAIKNSLNVWWQPSWVGDPSQTLAGLTRPEELESWLMATGIYGAVRNEANWAWEKGLPHALGLVQAEGTDIAILINANLLKYKRVPGEQGRVVEEAGIASMFPNHICGLAQRTHAQSGSHICDIASLDVWT